MYFSSISLVYIQEWNYVQLQQIWPNGFPKWLNQITVPSVMCEGSCCFWMWIFNSRLQIIGKVYSDLFIRSEIDPPTIVGEKLKPFLINVWYKFSSIFPNMVDVCSHLLKIIFQGIPWGPVVRTQHFHCSDPDSIPGQRTKVRQAAQCGRKENIF